MIPLTFSSARDPLITVKVGEGGATFRVYESVLCSSSEFFKAKKKPEWSKPDTAVDLTDQSDEAFNLYVNWLYTKNIPTATTLSQTNEDNEAEWKLLTASYVLGDVIIDVMFKDTIIDALQAKVKSTSGHTLWPCGGEIIQVIYDSTLEGSPLRRFIVQVYAYHAGQVELASALESAPKEFFYDILVAERLIRTPRPLKDFLVFWQCVYHSHGLTGDCYMKENEKEISDENDDDRKAKKPKHSRNDGFDDLVMPSRSSSRQKIQTLATNTGHISHPRR